MSTNPRDSVIKISCLFGMHRNILGFLGFIFCSTCALAEPFVIFKGDKLVSADAYSLRPSPAKTMSRPLEAIHQEVVTTQQEAVKMLQSKPPHFHFPYKTEGLSFGNVVPKNINNPKVPRPFFLIGGDERSRVWLQKNRERFKAAGAIGFVVEAKSMEEYKLAQAAAEGLAIVRFEWSDLAKRLGIDRYPVYVTATSIEQ